MTETPRKSLEPIEPVHHQQIMELYARYCQAADLDQSQEWADCFTSDGELYADGAALCRGREELVARRTSGRLAGNRQHWNGNIILTRDSRDRVIGTAYLMVVDIDPESGTPAVTMVGTYRDDIRLLPEGWKFARRELRFLAKQGALLPVNTLRT